ncbi:PepSY-associated TM helix domain-containing protein, partial [Winogradskyella sp.]|uniref:PepSY-associated TM helix domain-containing protein n=1 Tax=Winogradskyella sp. TaxID=1883156 RepID=UPI0025CF7AE5
KDAYAFVNLKTGEGEIEYVKTIPVLGQMTILHKTTNVWWIWFSDIFGVAMLTIAITGMFISKGKNSFKKRGWWLASLGLIFPFIFLFIIK